MALRLDPRLPLVWRTPDSLQLGVDRPPVVLTAVSRLDERLIDALRHGISRGGLDLIAAEEGASPAQVSQLLELLAPALVPPAGAAAPEADPAVGAAGHVAMAGSGPTADRIADALRRAGHDVRPLGSAADPAAAAARPSRPALVVLVAHFAIAPAVYGHWSREDVPHLPVVLGDRLATVGPLVVPGETVCCYCLDLARRDADPAWPAMATQLLGRTGPAETGLVPAEVAALAARPADRWLGAGENVLAAHRVVLDVRTGRITRRAALPHPGCGCRALPGSATAPAAPIAAARSGSTRAAARSAHA